LTNIQKNTLLIRGQGSFGNAVLDNFLDSELKDIRIFPEMNWNKIIWDIIIRKLLQDMPSI